MVSPIPSCIPSTSLQQQKGVTSWTHATSPTTFVAVPLPTTFDQQDVDQQCSANASDLRP